MSLFLVYNLFRAQLTLPLWTFVSALFGLLLYAFLLPFSRVYCGMHSVTDVTVGTLLGWFVTAVDIFATQYFGFDQWIVSPIMDSVAGELSTGQFWTVLAWAISAVLIFLILLHPNPCGPCPCIDDSLCFGGVLIGVLVGSARLGHVFAAHRYPDLGWSIISNCILFAFSIILLI
jgi:hypothetical protein